mmetsp:Transcript_110206/g.212319  ORF Transcript_110206/g.212319 Transcript_110206/m.212319 type:complete len:236 (-) Transcript_110206:183-890(-)
MALSMGPLSALYQWIRSILFVFESTFSDTCSRCLGDIFTCTFLGHSVRNRISKTMAACHGFAGRHDVHPWTYLGCTATFSRLPGPCREADPDPKSWHFVCCIGLSWCWWKLPHDTLSQTRCSLLGGDAVFCIIMCPHLCGAFSSHGTAKAKVGCAACSNASSYRAFWLWRAGGVEQGHADSNECGVGEHDDVLGSPPGNSVELFSTWAISRHPSNAWHGTHWKYHRCLSIDQGAC